MNSSGLSAAGLASVSLASQTLGLYKTAQTSMGLDCVESFFLTVSFLD